MRRRASALLLLLIVAAWAPALPGAGASDASIVTNTTWSGDVTLTGNLTVEGPAVLTLDPGTVVDADVYTIRVVNGGVLIAEDATLTSTAPLVSQGSHGSGLWPGVVVDTTSQAFLNNTVIERAETCLHVEGDVEAQDLTLQNCYIGLDIAGSATAEVDTLHVERADVFAVRNKGTLDLLSEARLVNVSIGLQAEGATYAANLEVEDALQGVKAVSGTTSIHGLTAASNKIALGASAGATLEAHDVTVSASGLAVDASDATALSVDVLDVSTTTTLLQGRSVAGLSLSNVTASISDDSTATKAIDLPCSGTCHLSSTNLALDNATVHVSGSGTTGFTDVVLSATNMTRPVLEATGSGTFEADTLTVLGMGGVLFRDLDTSMQDLHVDIGLGEGPAIDLMAGDHAWGDVVLERRYSAFDLSSQGLVARYATLQANALSATNLSTGVHLDTSDVTLSMMSSLDGRNAGVLLEQSTLSVDNLDTRLSTAGIEAEASSLHVQDWLADRHQLGLSLDDASTATVRTFDASGGTGSSDALGGGAFLWGGAQNTRVQTSTHDRFIETPVTFTDLDSNPIMATVMVHGFELTSDVNGAATLPLLSGGSAVVALANGAGVSDELYGGQSGQRVQVPVLPNGDWVLPSGVNAVLGAKPDGTAHVLNGDLTVRQGASLVLDGTTLELAAGHAAEIETGAVLTGQNGRLIADQIAALGSADLRGEEGRLLLDGPLSWSCSSGTSAIGVELLKPVSLTPGCEVTLLDGAVNASITAMTSARLELKSRMSVEVLDVGQPVAGVSIIVAGDLSVTDANGRVEGTTTALLVDETGTSETGTVMVRMDRNGRSDSVAWDTSGPLDHRFMSSTLDSGALSGWTVLEAQWSPYHLDGDLTVASDGTLTLRDGVLLRIADGVVIDVKGSLDIASATLQGPGAGARWAGILVDGDAETDVTLRGARLLEASPAFRHHGFGDVQMTSTTLARSSGADPLIEVLPGAQGSLNLVDVTLRDAGGACMRAQGPTIEMTVNGLLFDGCGDEAAWWRDLDVTASNLTVGAGAESGVYFAGVRGSVEGVDASAHDGPGASMHLQDIDNGLRLVDLTLVAGQGTAALTGGPNRALNLEDVHISGAPGLDVDDSSGLLQNLVFDGPGTGTAFIAHHGRSTSLEVHGLNISGYALGLDAHADSNEDPAPLRVQGATVQADVALAADGHPVDLHDAVLTGSVQIADATVKAVGGSLDLDQATVLGDGVLERWTVQRFVAERAGIPSDGRWSVTPSLPDVLTQVAEGQGAAIDLALLVGVVDATASQTTDQATVHLDVTGSPPVEATVTLGTGPVTLNVLGNEAPTVSFERPISGARVMESTPIMAQLTVDDDHEAVENLTYDWTVRDDMGVVMMRSTDVLMWNITDLPADLYLIEVTVTDAYDASTTVLLDVEVTPLDTDGDWTATCSELTWYDEQTATPCGPDVYDLDDDGDGIRDTRDAFPMDACASVDTDEDGQPDDVACPPGQSTWLVADQDDDGDGVPDTMEGVSQDDGPSTAGLVALTVFVLLGLILLLRRRGGGGQLADKDLVHL
ncbi:MAG: hypothetical protein ACPHQR_00710 [Candidatus Poseidoniaceae archaeon]